LKLTTSDAAALLDVDESTIHRWIEERGLPAERLAGRTLLNRAAVLEWATLNRVAVSSRVFAPAESGGEPLPSFSAALAAGGVHHGVPGATREEALREAVTRLALPEGTDAEDLLAFLLAREVSSSSAIGDGIAIPHVRMPIVLDVEEAIVNLCFLAAPVDFGATDGKPVTVLFALVTPTVHGHLHLLAALAFLLRDEPFRAAVKGAAPADVLLARAAEVERRGAGRPAAGGAG
jgi:PTS system nitrogen regulatory IIA component